MGKLETGQFIKELRKEKKLSQYQLADMIPISRQAISKWERGENSPNSDVLLILSEIFDVSVNELLLGKRIVEDEDVTSQVQQVALEILDDNEKKTKKIKKLSWIFIIVCAVLINLFLLYYFISSYNSVKVYTFFGDSDSFSTTKGILVTTRKKVYFRIGNFNNKKNLTIQKVTLLYKDGDKEIAIYSRKDSNIFLIDYAGYEEYFDFSKLSKIKKNLFLRISYEDGQEDIPLTLKQSFANNFLFWNNEKDIDMEELDSSVENFSEGLNFTTDKMECDGDLCSLYIEDEKIKFTYEQSSQILSVKKSMNEKMVEWHYFPKTNGLDYKEYQNDKLVQKLSIDLQTLKISDDNYKYYEDFKNNYIEKYL